MAARYILGHESILVHEPLPMCQSRSLVPHMWRFTYMARSMFRWCLYHHRLAVLIPSQLGDKEATGKGTVL